MLRTAISLGVAAVPEGLPTVATTTLAIGIREMRRRNVLVRRLDAVETLGSVQVFCLDKTGTLTTNHMTVVALQVGRRDLRVDQGELWDAERRIEPLKLRACQRLLEVLALCNEVELAEAGQHRLQGSPTEVALVELALACGLDVRSLRTDQPRLSIRHRAEDRPYMVTVHRLRGGRRLVAVKGSPEALLALCRLHLPNGRRRVLSEADRAQVQRANERMAGDALRVLGVAFAIQDRNAAEPLENLIWLGLVGMADPLRPGMITLLDQFHRAGIDTAIITGDQSATAYAIAKQLDLADGHALEILDSVSLDKLDPELLSGVIERVQVFSRVSPAHKLQIVQALQRAGRIVAMTGDGINDGPALKAADLGVAMGGGGTEVARSVADVVIEDDNLSTMVVAIRDGRTIYDNIRKSIRFLLSTNLSEIEVMVASLGLGLGQPLNPMQLLWINLATDIFPSLALAMEQPEPDVLEHSPRDPAKPIIDGNDLRRLGLESAFITSGTLFSYISALLRYGPGAKANTHTFMTLTLAQLLHSFSSRSEEHTILDRGRLPRNRYLETALLGSLAAQSLTVLVPGLRRLLGTTPLSPLDILIVTAGAAAPLLINEATKKAEAERRRRGSMPQDTMVDETLATSETTS
jgi:Ca2+-transporting ATPase